MLSSILWLGRKLQYVRSAVKRDLSLFDEDLIFDNFTFIKNYVKELGLNDDINKTLTSIFKYMEKFRDDEDARLTGAKKTYVQNNIEALWGLIESELNDILIFEAVKECALDKDCLIKLSKQEKSALFDESVWDKLSDIAKSDYSDSAKCILMGAATPAAMISLRAAEEEVRKYYTFKTKNEPGKKTWGTLTTELKKEPEIKEELLNHLDYIRKTRRNLAQHPDRIFNQREAERIFMDVLSMVHDIHEDME